MLLFKDYQQIIKTIILRRKCCSVTMKHPTASGGLCIQTPTYKFASTPMVQVYKTHNSVANDNANILESTSINKLATV